MQPLDGYRLMTLTMGFLILNVVGVISPAQANPLKIVSADYTRGPDAWECIFVHPDENGTCWLHVNDDRGDYFVLPGTTGRGRLLSRAIEPGEPGTRGEGLILYSYRISLLDVSEGRGEPCINRFTIDFGELKPLDYDQDGTPDDILIGIGAHHGGLGRYYLPTTAEQNDGRIIFEFAPPICPDASHFDGTPDLPESHVFYMASKRENTQVRVEIENTRGGVVPLEAIAPKPPSKGFPTPSPSGSFLGGCRVSGKLLPHVGASTPACRCLEDYGAREFRCALLDPDFVLILRTPLPIAPHKPVPLTWTLLPLTQLAGEVSIATEVPQGFTQLDKTPPRLTFPSTLPVEQASSERFSIMHPQQSDHYPIDTHVTMSDPKGKPVMDQTMAVVLPVGQGRPHE